MSTDIKPVMAVNTEYPCCGSHLRLLKHEDELPTIKRTCTHCGIHWVITRQFGAVHSWSPFRVDNLEWEVDV